jgi:hypothetical protein
VLAVAALLFLHQGMQADAPPATTERAPILTARQVSDVDAPPLLAERWFDEGWGLSLAPPAGWRRSPDASLNPVSTPPDPVFEIARFQLRLGDPTFYAQPVALTSGLLADAGAVLSVGVAREGGGLIGADPDPKGEVFRAVPGFLASDDDQSYDGVRTFTRYLHARASDRVVVVRLIADEDIWSTVASSFITSLSTLRAAPDKPNGPVAPVPPPPPTPAPEQVATDPSIEIRSQILARAHLMLGITYVWGGNSTARGMDCSAYVSRAWAVDRYSTDSIWHVSFPIAKTQLRPGDALNLTTGRDPKRLGHIRIFEAWANAAHTLMWVYEETPPRAVHRVIVYDDRYQPIRLFGLSDAGVAQVVPGTPAPERTSPPRPPRPVAKATPKPTVRRTVTPTIRPTVKPTVRATVGPTPKPTPRLPGWPAASGTARPTPTPTPNPR